MNIDEIQQATLPERIQTYRKRDVMLYALGLGYGSDPIDDRELAYVYEKNLVCQPTFVNLLCHPGPWLNNPVFGVDAARTVHGEQFFQLHSPLAPKGTMRSICRISAVADKGPRGAVACEERELFDSGSGTHVATVRSQLFLRGQGGHGGFGTPTAHLEPLPDRAPDHVVELLTLPQQALIYRLSGDTNPLHVDPAAAQKVGFDRPILHGLCTQGIASRALIASCCNHDGTRLRSMNLRFSNPVFPGESIQIEIFDEGGGNLRFRALSLGSGTVVLDRGSATIV